MAGTLAWERAGNQFFRTYDGPPMRWNIRITHSHIRAAPCGGIFAVWDRDDIVRPYNPDLNLNAKPTLQLYDAEGVLLSSIILDFGILHDVLVTIDEVVVVVTQSGLVRHYTDLGKNFVQLRLPFGVSHCFLTHDGYCCQASPSLVAEAGLKLAMVTLRSPTINAEPRYHLFSLSAECMRGETVVCQFVGGNSAIGRAPSLLLVFAAGTVVSYDTELSPLSCREVATNVGIKHVVVSPSSDLVVFSDGENLQVFATDFLALKASQTVTHHSVKWIGDQALAIGSQDGEAEIWGLESTSSELMTTFFEEEEVVLLSEIDGLRVVGQQHHQLYAPVYPPTVDTFKLGSVAPSAILYSCVDQIDSRSPRSDQTVKLLEQPRLARAIDGCIQAASYELDPKIQKRLLRAAAFGKSIAEAFDSTRYVDLLPTLRIGNALRNLNKHPLFITQRQYQVLNTARVLERLEHRKLWAEAVSVAQIEKIPFESVYIEWACDLILNNDEWGDEELLAALEAKMSKLGAFSHAKMALRAIEQGRQQLASTLLESEPVAGDRVKLLLEMGQTQMALEQAGWSGDPYLVDYVLLILTEQLSLPQLMRVIGTNKIAVDRQQTLVRIRDQQTQQLHEFLHHMDMRGLSLRIEFDEIAEKVTQSTSASEIDRQIHGLRALEKKFSGLNKSSQADARASVEWADLLSLQTQLEADYHTKFVGLSPAETISVLLKLSQVAQAHKLRVKLGINERQFWWLRLRALVERREFDLVWELGRAKKSPIGYQPFFDACHEAGNNETAAKFVEMINEASLEEKVKMLVKVKHIELARQMAEKYKDSQLLKMLNGL